MVLSLLCAPAWAAAPALLLAEQRPTTPPTQLEVIVIPKAPVRESSSTPRRGAATWPFTVRSSPVPSPLVEAPVSPGAESKTIQPAAVPEPQSTPIVVPNVSSASTANPPDLVPVSAAPPAVEPAGVSAAQTAGAAAEPVFEEQIAGAPAQSRDSKKTAEPATKNPNKNGAATAAQMSGETKEYLDEVNKQLDRVLQ